MSALMGKSANSEVLPGGSSPGFLGISLVRGLYLCTIIEEAVKDLLSCEAEASVKCEYKVEWNRWPR